MKNFKQLIANHLKERDAERFTKLDSQSLLKYTQIGEALRCRELEVEVLENLIADMETDS
jgi:hypothetical protein